MTYEQKEAYLDENEEEFEAHNEVKPCRCSQCREYLSISATYQAEQMRRDGKS